MSDPVDDEDATDPQDRLSDGWEPSRLPPIAPDGRGPPPPKLRVLAPEPPTLCRQGPCRHYHEMQILLDTAKPLDGSDSPDRRYTVRTCYPAYGREIDLNDTPVFECNLWDPIDSTFGPYGVLADRRKQYQASKAGQQYRSALNQWLAEQKAKRELEDAELEAQADAPATDELDKICSEMLPGDRLEARRTSDKGPLGLVEAFAAQPDLSKNVRLTLRRDSLYGAGDYQFRIVRPTSNGDAVVAIRTVTITQE